VLERDGYPPGVPCWIDTSQPDPESAVAFYGGLFGWDFEDMMPPDSEGRYFVARVRGGDVAAVGSLPAEAPPMAAWNTYIWVESADDAAAMVRDAGGNVLMEPFDVLDAGRMAVLTDPEGAAFCVWQAKEHRGAAIVNEPGSLNFNNLNTRDLDAAQAFYGAVFGWEIIHRSMWALPGYGDFLEQRNPGTRKNMDDAGAPERFEDVVASVSLAPDAEPQWGVTFGVDDADAVAARAGGLGGKVVVPPFDAPWVRMAIVSDPQGATFTASKFVPENKDLPAR
jgi:uncharacterized protein